MAGRMGMDKGQSLHGRLGLYCMYGSLSGKKMPGILSLAPYGLV